MVENLNYYLFIMYVCMYYDVWCCCIYIGYIQYTTNYNKYVCFVLFKFKYIVCWWWEVKVEINKIENLNYNNNDGILV